MTGKMMSFKVPQGCQIQCGKDQTQTDSVGRGNFNLLSVGDPAAQECKEKK